VVSDSRKHLQCFVQQAEGSNNHLQDCSYYMSPMSILTYGFMSATEFVEYVENTYVYTTD